MKMIIRYENGDRVEAILLAADSQHMRVAVESQSDTTEFARVGDCWYGDRGEAVEIEALISIPGTDVSRFCAEVRPRTLAAGSSFVGF